MLNISYSISKNLVCMLCPHNAYILQVLVNWFGINLYTSPQKALLDITYTGVLIKPCTLVCMYARKYVLAVVNSIYDPLGLVIPAREHERRKQETWMGQPITRRPPESGPGIHSKQKQAILFNYITQHYQKLVRTQPMEIRPIK